MPKDEQAPNRIMYFGGWVLAGLLGPIFVLGLDSLLRWIDPQYFVSHSIAMQLTNAIYFLLVLVLYPVSLVMLIGIGWEAPWQMLVMTFAVNAGLYLVFGIILWEIAYRDS